MAMEHLTTSRRDLLRAASTAVAYTAGAAIVGTGMALATNAKGATLGTPFRAAHARYEAAKHRFNTIAGPLEATAPTAFVREREAYMAALDDVESAPIADWNEFVDALDIACDGGEYNIDGADALKLLNVARRLAGRA